VTFVKRPSVWLEAVSAFRGTHVQAPNFAYALAVRKRDTTKRLDLSCARHFINGAEPIDVGVLDAFENTFSSASLLKRGVVFPTYGLAEHVVLVATNGKERITVDAAALAESKTVVESPAGGAHHLQTYAGCGAPHEDVVVKIVQSLDDDDDPDDETFVDVTHEAKVGEIWLSSPSVTGGYWGDIADNRNFGNRLPDDPGVYLRTGDEGFLRHGEIFVCGRIKDLLILNGKNYYPQDIERVLEHNFAAQIRPGNVAAFERDDACAVVAELRGDWRGDCWELADAIAKDVATEANVDVGRVVLVKPKTIPKTTSGKIARRRARAALQAGKLQVVLDHVLASSSASKAAASSKKRQPEDRGATAENDLEERLLRDLADVANVDAASLRADVPLSAVLGSLETAQFAGLLEHKYDCPKLPDDLLYRHDTTLRAVAALVSTFARAGPFDDDLYQRTIAPLEVEQPRAGATTNGGGKDDKDKPGYLVENCPCFIFCCPSLLKKKKKKKKEPSSARRGGTRASS